MKYFKVPNQVFDLNLTPIEFYVLCCLLKKQTKQRRTQSGELPLFIGLLKCADCGGLMHFKPDMTTACEYSGYD